MSPQLQEAIRSPEGLMIAGMTAIAMSCLFVLFTVVANWLDRRAETRRQQSVAEDRRMRRLIDNMAEQDPQAGARWTP